MDKEIIDVKRGKIIDAIVAEKLLPLKDGG